MCRYHKHGIPYRMPYACFDCRISLKWDDMYFGDTESTPRDAHPCSNCGRDMARMGHDFQAPRKQNKAQWRKVRLLHAAGITFNSCGCEGPGYRPQTLSEAKNRIKLRTEEENFRDDARYGRWGYEYRQKKPAGRYV